MNNIICRSSLFQYCTFLISVLLHIILCSSQTNAQSAFTSTTVVQVTPSLKDFPIGLGALDVSITFSGPMNTAVDPEVSFGVFEPFEGTMVQPTTPSAWITSMTWTGTALLGTSTTSGLATFKIKGARNESNVELPESTSFHFSISTSIGVSLPQVIAIGIGKNLIYWSEQDKPTTFSHYNIRRSEFNYDDPQDLFPPPSQINTEPILTSRFIDDNVVPFQPYVYVVYLAEIDGTETQWTLPLLHINNFPPEPNVPIDSEFTKVFHWNLYQ